MQFSAHLTPRRCVSHRLCAGALDGASVLESCWGEDGSRRWAQSGAACSAGREECRRGTRERAFATTHT
jgi:hypothetical protein